MSVELDPVELGFKRPFNHEVSETLRLHNPHSEPVAFKVKTTAPKQYCVRPNSGRIEGGKSVEVQVLLQAMKEDPPPDAKCRDKFLVQSVQLPADKEISNVSAIWTSVEQTAKSSIQEKKIRVVFLPADGTPRTNGVHHEGSARSPSPEQGAFTPKHSTSQIVTSTPVGAVSSIESRPEGARSSAEAAATARNPAASSGPAGVVGGVVESVANAIPTSREELARQLEEAKATIVRLTQQGQEQGGLRQRKTEAVGKDAKDKLASGSTAVRSGEQQSVGGVPVQVTAALCLLCFLLAYFFF